MLWIEQSTIDELNAKFAGEVSTAVVGSADLDLIGLKLRGIGRRMAETFWTMIEDRPDDAIADVIEKVSKAILDDVTEAAAASDLLPPLRYVVAVEAVKGFRVRLGELIKASHRQMGGSVQ